MVTLSTLSMTTWHKAQPPLRPDETLDGSEKSASNWRLGWTGLTGWGLA